MNPELTKARTVSHLLDKLCVPRDGIFAKRLFRGRDTYSGFWVSNRGMLKEVLAEIFVCYQRTLRRVHPYSPGGSREATQIVCQAWADLYSLFQKRGVTL